MNNLKATCTDIGSFNQIRTPKLQNIELVAINLTAEYMSINTELQSFKSLQGAYLEPMIERSVYNKRRRKLFGYTEAVRIRLSEMFSHLADAFIVDPKPIPICNYARAGR